MQFRVFTLVFTFYEISTRVNLAVRFTKKMYLFEFLAGVYVPERDGRALTC